MDVMEKLVELLEPHMSGLACEYESGSCELTSCRSCNARNIADHLISNGVTVQEWISVTERLPEHGDVVLCFMKFGEHRILQWDNVSSLWLGYGHGDDWQKADVTNWMPLPEPQKEDNCEILQRLCWL